MPSVPSTDLRHDGRLAPLARVSPASRPVWPGVRCRPQGRSHRLRAQACLRSSVPGSCDRRSRGLSCQAWRKGQSPQGGLQNVLNGLPHRRAQPRVIFLIVVQLLSRVQLFATP